MLEETLLTITEAAAKCPRRVSAHSVWRWSRKGIRARNGETIRLRSVRVGGAIMIPEAAPSEFFRELALADAAYLDTPPPLKPAPVRGRRSAHDAALAESKRMGLA